jgi:hypothetical protein
MILMSHELLLYNEVPLGWTAIARSSLVQEKIPGKGNTSQVFKPYAAGKESG